MSLVPTELFSFERKRQSPGIRYKIDFLCELLGDYLERMAAIDVHLVALEIRGNEVTVRYMVLESSGYSSFIRSSNAIMYARLVIKHSRRIDIREKYTEQLVASELELSHSSH